MSQRFESTPAITFARILPQPSPQRPVHGRMENANRGHCRLRSTSCRPSYYRYAAAEGAEEEEEEAPYIHVATNGTLYRDV